MESYGSVVGIVGVVFFATLIRSAVGFGEALIAVPLLALFIPVELAAPLAVLVSITVAGVIVMQDWNKIEARSAAWLILSTLLGIPLGLLLLKLVAEPLVKAILAVVIITFSTYCLRSRRALELKNDRLAWAFGFAAGILGGAYGMNGPPLVIYGSLRRWSPQHFRATLQGYFLPASLVGMCGYWLTGLWVPAVTWFFLLSLPFALVAIFLGRIVNQRLKGHRFLIVVHFGLILVGAALLAQALFGRVGLRHPIPRACNIVVASLPPSRPSAIIAAGPRCATHQDGAPHACLPSGENPFSSCPHHPRRVPAGRACQPNIR
jgi:uncharacterized membrane protein YfcA